MAVPKKKKIIKKVSHKKSTKKVSKIKKVVHKVVRKQLKPLHLKKPLSNPVISPLENSYWESEAVFNPGAVLHNGRVHIFYRALGPDGISRVGYASSGDGIHFDTRNAHPVYMPEISTRSAKYRPYTSPARLVYNPKLYASGGGWGGCEDPRAVKLNGRIYLTFNMFNGWNSIRIGMTSISERDFDNCFWNWSPCIFLSPPEERHKSWVLFPEKINGQYAIFHNLYHEDPMQVAIEYVDEIEVSEPFYLKSVDPHHLPDRDLAWHYRTRSVGPPPIKTEEGWLLFYHAMDKNDPHRYKLGALLLDLNDPRKILYRSSYPILEPDEWYENDWKPGIIYASGAVVKDGTLFIYYGGGDKHIAVAHTNLKDFLHKLMKHEHATLSVEKSVLGK
jgi:beta-1,2-mannobiose phosphorylase / 1,2-beta-oligomannan phosphorylase